MEFESPPKNLSEEIVQSVSLVGSLNLDLVVCTVSVHMHSWVIPLMPFEKVLRFGCTVMMGR